MANFFTFNVTYGGKETLDFVIKPIFIGKNPFEMQGFTVKSNIKSSEKLNYFAGIGKRLKTYVKGWSGVTGGVYSQRTITVVKLKAEWAEDGNNFQNTVFEYATKNGLDENNIAGTVLDTIMHIAIKEGVASDVFRLAWLADPNKETLLNGNFSGTADADYNQFTGMLKLLRDNSATSPVAGTQIKRIELSHSAVKQKATMTLTGSSGTATITLMGRTYIATYVSSPTQTATNFVTANAAAILLRGIVLTSSGADLIFESERAGQPFLNPTIANLTTDLTGSVAATTANTVPGALAAGEILATLKLMHVGASAVLRAMPKNQKMFIMDSLSYENFLTSQEAKTTEIAQTMELYGVEYPTWRGIPIIVAEWDVYQDADFRVGYPNHIIYTTVDNFIIGTDARSDENSVRVWWAENEEENRYKVILKMGVQFVHADLSVIAY